MKMWPSNLVVRYAAAALPRDCRAGRLVLLETALAIMVGASACSRATDAPSVQPQAAESRSIARGRESAAPVAIEPAAHHSSPVVAAARESAVSSLPVVSGLASEAVPPQLAAELSHLDPAAEDWQTEVFSEQALSQLKALGRHMVSGEPGSEAELGTFLTADFHCPSLRPAVLPTVFEAKQFHVRRAEDLPSEQSTAGGRYAGARGLADALTELLQPFRQTRPLKVHFKVVGVWQDDGKWMTKARVQIAGSTPAGSLQQNSVWSCRWSTPQDGAAPLLEHLEVGQLEEIVFRGQAPTLYVENTAGVLGENESYRQQLLPELEHWRDSIDWRFGLDVAGPYGLAVGDANGDGLDDVLICEPGGLPNRLYVQNPDGTAVDIAASAGVDFLEPCEAALFLDLDNDGDQDLVIASGRSLLVLENEGGAKFCLRQVLPMGGLTRSLCAADFDQDGLLDVYVCCYIPLGQGSVDVGIALPMPMHDANNGAPNHLLRNTGQWRFEDVTAQVGLDQNNRRFSYAASWEDFDSDGDLDLYVANDFGRNNLYRNDGGRFVDIADGAGVEDMASGMSVAWGDYNRDGRMDLYVGNMFSSAGNRIAFQRRFKEGAGEETVGQFRRFARGNTLFENVGDGAFRDVTDEAHVAMGRWAWGSVFVDIDNSGWQDLVVGNGFITGRPALDDL